MTFSEYQDKAATFNKVKEENKLYYLPLGICGETGEIANKVKKIIRDHDFKITESVAEDIIDELGDTLWYLSEMARFFGYDLEVVAVKNIAKLKDRQARGKIKGSGDKR